MNNTNKFPLKAVLALLALIIGCEAGYVPAQPQNPNKFKVGVFKADGMIVPFAEYRYGLWWNP